MDYEPITEYSVIPKILVPTKSRRRRVLTEILDDIAKFLNYDVNLEEKNPNIFEVFNKLQDQELTYDKFKEEINFLLMDPNNEESQANLYQMFFNQNKEETADLNKLKQVFEYYGQVFSDDDYESIMNFLGDGENITFETFQKFMNKKFKK